MRKTRKAKSKKVSRTSKRAVKRGKRQVVRRKARLVRQRLTSEQREVIRAERQAEKDFNTEIRYGVLIAVLQTWKMPRFRKLAKVAAKYIKTLDSKLDSLRSEYAWLNR